MNQEAFKSIQNYLNRLVGQVGKIKKDKTNNLAESFFSVVCRFTHGKIVNFVTGG